MAPEKMQEEFDKIHRKMNWFIGTALGIMIPCLILIIGGWARSEVKYNEHEKAIVSLKDDFNYVRKNALNEKAFESHINADKLHKEAVDKLINDPVAKSAVEYFNKGWDDLNSKILEGQTEIVPRGIMQNNEKLNK